MLAERIETPELVIIELGQIAWRTVVEELKDITHHSVPEAICMLLHMGRGSGASKAHV